MICSRCKLMMKSGTSYEKGKERRFDECPKCHEKKYNKGTNFQQLMKIGIGK